MKQLLKITAATAVLALGMSGANAQMFLQTDPESDNKVIVDSETERRFSVMEGEGTALADCPEGSFLISPDPEDESSQIATDCTTQSIYRMQGDDGTFKAQGYPEGTMLLSSDENDQKQVTTEEEAERRAAPMGQQPR